MRRLVNIVPVKYFTSSVMTSNEDPQMQTKVTPEVSSSSDLSTEVQENDDSKPWEKPGFIGSARRAHRILQRYVWDDPDKPQDEKWFLFKLDLFLLTSSCLGYFSKNLDQANIGNAYVSGVGLSFLSS
jgi:ACS family pantothenate transporter-like MFS transporter